MLVAVTIREELARTILVEAPDVDTAERYVDEELYQHEEIILDSSDYAGCHIEGMSASRAWYKADSKPDYIVPKGWGE